MHGSCLGRKRSWPSGRRLISTEGRFEVGGGYTLIITFDINNVHPDGSYMLSCSAAGLSIHVVHGQCRCIRRGPVLCTVYCVLCTVYCVLCTVYCVRCTVYCVLCTVYCVLCTVSSPCFSGRFEKRIETLASPHLCFIHPLCNLYVHRSKERLKRSRTTRRYASPHTALRLALLMLRTNPHDPTRSHTAFLFLAFPHARARTHLRNPACPPTRQP